MLGVLLDTVAARARCVGRTPRGVLPRTTRQELQMPRKMILGIIASVAFCGAIGADASAATINLEMSQGAAFSALGHSCGGIKEKVYETGSAANGYPQGNVFMETTCGGSGRG